MLYTETTKNNGYDMKWSNLPNLITGFRVSLVPLFIICFYVGGIWRYPGAFLVFAISMVTDWLDGYLARKLGQSSSFGAFLDPLADKFIVIAALVLLVEEQSSVLFTIPAVIIILREVMVSGLREWMAELGLRGSVEVSILGKIKTAIQMFAIFFVMLQLNLYQEKVHLIGYICLYAAAIISVWSMFNYLLAAQRARSEVSLGT